MTALAGRAPSMPPARPTVRTAMIMGLPFSVHVRGVGEDPAQQRMVDDAARQVWSTLRWADDVFSTYRDDSDIARIRAGELRVPDADPAVAEVLDLAATAHRLTNGAFDIHGPAGLDPSGIVKGWAAARSAAPLLRLGADFTLNAGGDVLVHAATRHRPWRIGIEHPDDPSGLIAVVQLHQGAVATSGKSHRGEHIWAPDRMAAPADRDSSGDGGRPVPAVVGHPGNRRGRRWSDECRTPSVAVGT